MSLYELAILGEPTPEERTQLTETLQFLLEDFGLEIDREIVIHDAASVNHRNRHTAFAAIYFGTAAQLDQPAMQQLKAESVPIIPTIAEAGDFSTDIPGFLQFANGMRRTAADASFVQLATAALECVGLLRHQRRVFVSYRRTESRAAAIQLHDVLTAHGFDVFLDTHDIRPGEPFQEVLWHRLCDCDVLIMLDTATYFESRWTRAEFGRALAKEIQVLRVVWPGVMPNPATAMAETLYLDIADLVSADGPLYDGRLSEIQLAVERLRSRSIAARYLSLTGKLRVEVERIGATVEAVGPHRKISVKLPDDRVLHAYPVIGVPSAPILNEIVDKAHQAGHDNRTALIYDHIGIRERWAAHLSWLQSHVRDVRWIKVTEAAWQLADWEE